MTRLLLRGAHKSKRTMIERSAGLMRHLVIDFFYLCTFVTPKVFSSVFTVWCQTTNINFVTDLLRLLCKELPDKQK